MEAFIGFLTRAVYNTHVSEDQETPSPYIPAAPSLQEDFFSHYSCLFSTCPLLIGINSALALHFSSARL